MGRDPAHRFEFIQSRASAIEDWAATRRTGLSLSKAGRVRSRMMRSTPNVDLDLAKQLWTMGGGHVIGTEAVVCSSLPAIRADRYRLCRKADQWFDMTLRLLVLWRSRISGQRPPVVLKELGAGYLGHMDALPRKRTINFKSS
jgi:hypothetical protein